jgi:hypothetical protein
MVYIVLSLQRPEPKSRPKWVRVTPEPVCRATAAKAVEQQWSAGRIARAVPHNETRVAA